MVTLHYSRAGPEYSIIRIFVRWVGIRFSILRFEYFFFFNTCIPHEMVLNLSAWLNICNRPFANERSSCWPIARAARFWIIISRSTFYCTIVIFRQVVEKTLEFFCVYLMIICALLFIPSFAFIHPKFAKLNDIPFYTVNSFLLLDSVILHVFSLQDDTHTEYCLGLMASLGALVQMFDWVNTTD